ncbi:MAG: hypothetical protein ACT4OF_02185 [Caulobacteraceae bacterium]
MANGEVRIRLTSDDGGAYVKTIQPGAGAWQRSHLHQTLVETYVVQKGWMALVELIDDEPKTTLQLPGDVTSTQPGIAHNVYLSANTVIHTVKHGGKADWAPCERLDSIVSGWSESEIRANAVKPPLALAAEDRYAAYASIYNHLDNLIWLVPGFVLTVGLSGFGLVLELASRTPRESAQMLGGLLLALAVFFFLGGYSVMRLRHHHTLMGDELRLIEGEGYFVRRSKTLRSRYLPSAPHLFMTMFFVMSGALLLVSLLLFGAWAPFLDLFTPLPQASQ